MIAIVTHLARAEVDARPIASVDEFRARTRAIAAQHASTVDRAAALGFAADRVAYAFSGGYQAALERLVGPASSERIACLCASEQGGAHPRNIKTRLDPAGGGWTLTGHKTWVTMATDADELLIVASVGVDAGGKNRLRVARVPSSREGITIRPRPAAPFAPEIAHGEVVLDRVAVGAAELLEGDGYDAVLKPFRTIEDIHVIAALVGYLVSVGRAHGWPRAWLEEALAVIVTLRALGAEPPSDPAVHLALAGALRTARRVIEGSEPSWASAPSELRERWERDKVLLTVADNARAKRSEAAWARMEPTSLGR
jgi:alkylation response protein AidB-like acyl-CoA dehydrogenase